MVSQQLVILCQRGFLAMVFALVASMMIATAAAPPAHVSSQQALLSPHIRRGQILTWFATQTHIWPRWMLARCRTCGPDSHAILLACTVTSDDRNGFALSRRVRPFLANQPHTPTLEHPPIIIHNGHEFKIDRSPLNADPICMFYSMAMYGSPPPVIKVGTTWHFERPSSFGGSRGTTTVSKLDVKTNTVSLHVAESGAGSALINMTISNGGIIERESDQWDSNLESSALPRSIASPTDIISWSAQQQSLAKLWNYPPAEVVPFSALPDIVNPNGHIVSIWQVQPNVTLIRIWHFGPFSLQSLRPTLPRLRDVFLALGVALLVVVVSRAAMMLFQTIRGQTIVSPRAKRRRVLLEIALAVVAVAGSMWWIYR
jgi:hypothetical protein